MKVFRLYSFCHGTRCICLGVLRIALPGKLPERWALWGETMVGTMGSYLHDHGMGNGCINGVNANGRLELESFVRQRCT